jgi:hypothetical protein
MSYIIEEVSHKSMSLWRGSTVVSRRVEPVDLDERFIIDEILLEQGFSTSFYFYNFSYSWSLRHFTIFYFILYYDKQMHNLRKYCAFFGRGTKQ